MYQIIQLHTDLFPQIAKINYKNLIIELPFFTAPANDKSGSGEIDTKLIIQPLQTNALCAIPHTNTKKKHSIKGTRNEPNRNHTNFKCTQIRKLKKYTHFFGKIWNNANTTPTFELGLLRLIHQSMGGDSSCRSFSIAHFARSFFLSLSLLHFSDCRTFCYGFFVLLHLIPLTRKLNSLLLKDLQKRVSLFLILKMN